MKRTMIVGLIVLIVLGGAFLAWRFSQKDPVDTAEAFLEELAKQDFAGAQAYFTVESNLGESELRGAFERFKGAFGLARIVIDDFAPISKTNKEAEFSFELSYESHDFAPLTVSSTLTLVREGLFDEWKIAWKDNLPLPDYGSGAKYGRVRLEPKRGVILDNAGQIVAGEGSLVSVGVQPDRIKEPEELLRILQEQLGLRPEYVRSQYEAPGVQGHWFVPLANLSEAEYLRVDPVLRPLPGVFFKRAEARAYPEGMVLGHITGYLGEVTGAMLESYPERDYLSGEIAGRSGLESSQDDRLRGRPGYRFYVEPEGGTRTVLAEKRVVPGQNVELTIDSQMQGLAYQVLGSRLGALVVLDAETGAILALASTPSYDPNEFTGGISTKRWQELSTNLGKPMFNRALQGLYPPGSVFKALTVAAALDQGLYEPTSVFVDKGELGVEGNIIRNFQRQVFGEHDLHRALVDSINTTVAQVGLSLGAKQLEEYFKAWGLDQSYRLGLPMLSGQIGNPGRSKVALAWSAIGQDQVLLTPLHMAQIFSVFANHGNVPPIHLIKVEEQPTTSPALKPETVSQINAMLQDVVLQGTGKDAGGTGLTIYGKTGTAEVVGGGMHAWFGGHTELLSGQKLAFALLVEEGGVGGQVAAPLVREFLGRLNQ